MVRSTPRKLVPVSKLAEFADNPTAFRKTRGQVRDPEAAAAGTRAHREQGRPRQGGRRLASAAIIAGLVVVVLWVLFR